MVDRRKFLLTYCAAAIYAPLARAAEAAPDLKITRIVGFRLPSKRNKVAGKNARLGVHGDRTTDRMVRIYTTAGIEGLGNCRTTEKEAARLLGRSPLDFFRSQERRMRSPFGAGSMPLWDLAGKILGKPVYELLGGAGPEQVPVYDGSIYFADLLPQYADRWRDRFRQEIDMGRRLGHRAFKIKIGRGNKWMPRREGDDRDVEVIEVIRKHGGPEILIGVDANNGYDLAGAKRFLERAGQYEIAFAEEVFPETVEECLAFKQFIKEHNWQTLVADGETQSRLEAYKPFIEARAIDVFQGDMNRFGFEGILTEAAWAREKGLQVAPHNWGSLVGFYMQLQVGRAIPNFYRAEHDPLTSRALVAEGYAVKDGKATVPDAPGCGLALNEKAFRDECRIDFDLRL